MKGKKNIAVLIAALAVVAAAIAAAIVFHAQIAAFFRSLTAKLEAPAGGGSDPKPQFTPEEREDFADI